jgi:hypothetical protein
MKVIIKIEDDNEMGVKASYNTKDNGVEDKGAAKIATTVLRVMKLLNTAVAPTIVEVAAALEIAQSVVEKQKAAAAADEDDEDEI